MDGGAWWVAVHGVAGGRTRLSDFTFTFHFHLSMEFPRQEYWSRLPFPSPEDIPDPGIQLGFPALQTVSLLSEPPGKPGSFYRLPTFLGLGMDPFLHVQSQ